MDGYLEVRDQGLVKLDRVGRMDGQIRMSVILIGPYV